MQLTPNLKLKKPEGTDNVNIDDFNGNADLLDAAITGKVDKVTGKGLSTEDYTSAEKSKLAGIAAGANNYAHPASHPSSMITQDASNRFVTDAEKTAWNAKAGTAQATGSAAGLMSAADKSKLDGVAAGANNYVHPATHAPSVIAQDANNRFVTDAEKATWNAKANTTAATTTTAGLMSGADKSKLDSVAVGAQVNTVTSVAGRTGAVALAKGDVGLGNVDNVQQAPLATYNAHLADYVRQPGYGTTAGTGVAYTVTLTPALTAYADGVAVAIKTHVANTGTATLNVNGLGAKSVLDSKGRALIAGKLAASGVYTLRYNGTAFILQGEGGDYGTAIAADVLAGKTIGTDNGIISGTMVDRAGDTAALSAAVSGTTLRLRTSEGYRDGINDFVTATAAQLNAVGIGNIEMARVFVQSTFPNNPQLHDILVKTSNSISNYVISDNINETKVNGNAQILFTEPVVKGTVQKTKIVTTDTTGKQRIINGLLEIYGRLSIAKLWNGSKWIYEDAYYYNGTTWVKFSSANNYDVIVATNSISNSLKKFDSTMNAKWSSNVASYHPGNNYTHLAMDENGSVYWHGHVTNNVDIGFYISKYDSNGNRLISAYVQSNIRSFAVGNKYMYWGTGNLNPNFSVVQVGRRNKNDLTAPQGTNHLHYYDTSTIFSLEASSADMLYAAFNLSGSLAVKQFDCSSEKDGVVFIKSTSGSSKPFNTQPFGIALSADGQYVFIVSGTQISKKRTSDFSVVGTDVESNRGGLDFKNIVCDSEYLYVTSEATKTFEKYRQSDMSFILSGKAQWLASENTAQCIDITPDGIVSIGLASGHIYRYDAETGNLLSTSTPMGNQIIRSIISHPRIGAFPTFW
ncbi:hypothetical protein [Paenibacillus paeoniae]|uniref:hypothetical protein n=1 Tax=Paenibacillus paeoniae TaxID=2292705 RepID=UPI001981468F|nr:hypothetical protein [Paenibacillus paeoniae]